MIRVRSGCASKWTASISLEEPKVERLRKPASHKSLGAFTLVELLVVIAIIGVLVALLLPAIQAARESARYAQCRNNLHQLGIGFHLHHDQLGFFPTAGRTWWSYPTYVNGVPATGAKQEVGWGFQILPFVEQRNLWVGDPGKTPEENFDIIAAHPVSIYFCPTRRPASVSSNGRAQNDYAGGSYGTKPDGVMTRVEPWSTGPILLRDASDIEDGLSCTLLLGEKRLNVAYLNQSALDDNEGFVCGWDQDILRKIDVGPRQDLNLQVKSLEQATGDYLFGASHASGFNILLCDSSVRSLSYDIDPLIFYNLGKINDGTPIEIP
jgi:prepilin-type N-terminal cleavage/methylation domain-containing protein